MRTIAIVGGGFSGTMAAINLARLTTSPLRIVLINRQFPVGRGIAYSTRQSEHLLNVVARNMSALTDQPSHFLQWLRTRSEYADVPEAELRETFVPRKIYGDYLRSLFLWYSQPVDGRRDVEMEVIDGSAVDIVPAGRRATVVVDTAGAIEADRVLLATGNQPPAEIRCGDAAFEHARYLASPWGDITRRLPERDEDVVLLGTGLTMIDVFLTLKSLGWRGTIQAVSRSGLLPLAHFKGIEYNEFPSANVAQSRLEELVESIERHCAQLTERGANPAILVDKLRPYSQRIWQNFTLDEKREFCRRYRSRWNTTRHRIAPQIHRQLREAIDEGTLKIVRGSIDGLEAAGDRVRVRVQGSDGQRQMLDAGLVVNCTGPLEKFTQAQTELFCNLLERGLIAPDELDMGVQVGPDFAVIDRGGSPSNFLYAMGPLLKGSLWETTAVPELRVQAFRVASMLLEEVPSRERGKVEWPSQVDTEVLEYYI